MSNKIIFNINNKIINNFSNKINKFLTISNIKINKHFKNNLWMKIKYINKIINKNNIIKIKIMIK